MESEQNPLARIEKESSKAHTAFCDYARMGAGRSLGKLHEQYTGDKSGQSRGKVGAEKPPTKHLSTLETWSSKHNWQDRVKVYDTHIEAEKTAEAQRLRTEGLAADHARIYELDKLYRALDREFDGGKGIWYSDIKVSSRGDEVEVPAFNNALISQMRGVLDDIAKEVGGRKQRLEHSGSVDLAMLHTLSDAQLARLAAGEDPAVVLGDD